MNANSKFVQFQPQVQSPEKPEQPDIPADASLEDKVVAAMKSVYDPEIPVNIYDLGLIYEVNISDDKVVDVKMTLTAPGCPVAGILPGQVECAIKDVDEVKDAHVELVWDPPWTKDRMSDEAKLELGMF
jgi:FeS assembly SUF system protein